MPDRFTAPHGAALAGLALLASAGMAGTALSQVPKQPKQFPIGMQWTLVSLNGKAVGDNRPTMMIDEALRARGFAGCNTFSATAYPLAQQRIAVGPIALTRKACDKGVMERERAFLVVFRTAQAWDVKDGQLILGGQNGELRFERTL